MCDLALQLDNSEGKAISNAALPSHTCISPAAESKMRARLDGRPVLPVRPVPTNGLA